MKKDLVLINPFKSIVPRKLLERINKDDEYHITESTVTSKLDKLAEDKATGVAIWFVSRAIQLKKSIADFNEFNRLASKWYMRVVLIIGDGSMPKIKTDALIIPLSKANQELGKVFENHFGERDRVAGKEASLKKKEESAMASVLLGGSKKTKNATLNMEVHGELENIFDDVNMSNELDALDAKLAKAEGRHHPLHDTDAETDADRAKIKNKKKAPVRMKDDPKLDLEKSFLDLIQGGSTDELSEVFDEITEVEEKKNYLEDISENCPHISLWSPRGRMDINCFLKVNNSGPQDEFVLKWVLNKKGVEFEKQIADGEWEEICIRGNIDKGGLFFMIKNPKEYYKDGAIKIPVPEMIWKVERRENPRLRFLSWEKAFFTLDSADDEKKTKYRIGDISEGGFRINVAKADKSLLKVGETFSKAIMEIDGKEMILDCKVVWFDDIGFTTISKREKFAAGISIVQMESSDREIIKNFINTKLQVAQDETFEEILEQKA